MTYDRERLLREYGPQSDEEMEERRRHYERTWSRSVLADVCPRCGERLSFHPPDVTRLGCDVAAERAEAADDV
jgi:hypothetical protein